MRRKAKAEDIEALARIAARLAGRNPDERTTLKLGDVVAFDNVAWCYPDFIARAESAYEALSAARLLSPEELGGNAADQAGGAAAPGR